MDSRDFPKNRFTISPMIELFAPMAATAAVLSSPAKFPTTAMSEALKSSVQKDDLYTIPLILHRRAGLQRRIALWAQTEPEHLNIAATYNVVNGNAINFVKSGLGYFLTIEDLLSPEVNPGLCFRPLDPLLETHYALSWKRYSVLSNAAKAFLSEINNLGCL